MESKKIINNNLKDKNEKVKKSSPILVLKHEYLIAQLIPTKSSKTSNANKLFDEINKMHHTITNKDLIKKNKKVVLNQQFKLSYYIQIKKPVVNFFIIYPKEYKNSIEIALKSIWRGLEIKYLDNFPIDLDQFAKKQLVYENKDYLAVNSDKTEKYLLNSLASLSDYLYDDEEEIGIFYNFIPTRKQESEYFKAEVYKRGIEEYKKGANFSNKLNIPSIGIELLKQTVSFTEETVSTVLGNSDKKSTAFISVPRKPSGATVNKAKTDLCKTQIVTLTKAKDKFDNERLFEEIDKAFDIISGDNKFTLKKIRDKNGPSLNAQLYNPVISNVSVNRTCIKECLNFTKLPNRDLLKMYSEKIQHNNSIEMSIPSCLLDGVRFIGYTKQNGKEIAVYYSTDDQIQRAEVVVIGPKGAGKTHFTTNMALNSMKIGRGVIVIEIIEDCPMCKAIIKQTPKEQIVNIDCRYEENIPAVCFNEIEMWENMPKKLKIERAIQRGQQLETFLNSIQTDDGAMTARMIKYFYAACAVTYCVDIYASFHDIMQVLQKPDIRHEYIESLDFEIKQMLNTRIDILNELTKDNGSNDDNKISGILNREAQFTSVSYQAELIAKKKSHDNIDFKKALQENKTILIQLPENVFTNPTIKNTMATFFLSKIWNAKKQLSVDKDKQPTELYFDEFYKCTNATRIFEDIFVEGRKFNLTSVVTIHTLSELSTRCSDRLINGGASYILLYGTNMTEFKKLSSYIDENIEYDDLKDIERFHGLCIIKNEDCNCSSFIARFPKEFPEPNLNYKKIDNNK